MALTVRKIHDFLTGTLKYNGTVVDLAKVAAIPAGGTTDQVLKKNSATNYDTSWSTPSAGSVDEVQMWMI